MGKKYFSIKKVFRYGDVVESIYINRTERMDF